MKVSHFTMLLCLAGCFATSLPRAAADDNPVAPNPAEAPPERVIKDVNFKGAKVREVVEFLRQRAAANIVTGPEVDDLPVAELQLQNVTVIAAANAITAATGGAVAVSFRAAGPNLGDIITLRYTPAVAAKTEIISRVFLLPNWREADFDKEVSATVEATHKAINLYNDAVAGKGRLPFPSLDVHRPTRLLLAAGPRASMDIVSQVIGAIKGETVVVPSENPTAGTVKATILGQVERPGVYRLVNASLGQLVGQAGGFTRSGDPKRISVLSKDGSKTNVDFSKGATSYPLQEEDVVTVNANGLVF